MLLGIDHLVIAVADPHEAAAELEARIGLACSGGGRHPSWGTWNRLAWFGDTYAELIGVFDRSLAPSGAVSRAVVAALDRGAEGLITYALATDDAGADLVRLRGAGSELSDLEARSRTRPDGEVVRWRAAFPATLASDEPPFIVEHEPVGAEWGPEARRERARFRHPIGGPVRLRAMSLPVRDPAATAARYRAALGLHATGEPRTIVVGDQAVRLLGATDT
ncbi:MAG TPA: VOC family protein, partial [Candidatus Deferrimicrobiaceae bacterium]|nr:VOC family protein [Candidatus Deferrimicrobiaceae bacterium]